MAAGEWARTWDATKDDFKDATGKSKPDAKKLKIVLTTVSTHKSNVHDALGDVDKSYAAYDGAIQKFSSGKAKEKDVADCLNKFGRDVEAFRKAAAAYEPAIEKAVEQNLADNQDVKTAYYRACKMLQKTLVSIEKDIASYQKILFNSFQMAKKEMTTLEAYTSQILQLVDSTVAKGRSFTAKCKVLAAKKGGLAEAVKFFNDGIQKATRDVTQNLGNVKKLRNLDPPKPPLDYLTARNGGNYTLPATITDQKFAAEIKELDSNFKAVEAWLKTAA